MRHFFLTVAAIIFLFCAVFVYADYNEPPGWNDCNDFTHQSWDFNYPAELEPVGTELPALPDGEPNWINPFGEPCLISVDFNDFLPIPGIVGWMYNYDDQGFYTERRGYYGGMGNTTVTFRIPNRQRQPLWRKQIWVQMTYLARNDGGKTYDIAVATEPNFSDANVPELALLQLEEPNELQGDISKWYRLTAAYVLPDQPAQEYVRLTAWRYPVDSNHAMGGPVMIDQVDIDTRCINPDFVQDDIINLADFASLAAGYKSNDPNTDLFPDGQINLDDLDVLLYDWLEQNQSP